MNLEPGALIVILLSFVATFAAARILGRGWREKRRKRGQEEARAAMLATETRQARRARERREAGRR